MHRSNKGFIISKVNQFGGHKDYGEDANPELLETGTCPHGEHYSIFKKVYSLEKQPGPREEINVCKSKCEKCRTKQWNE
ncbi:hypothetical protein P4K96_18320 [Bacillus cereus]|nr:hypothetical protein [Bacillus cereus]